MQPRFIIKTHTGSLKPGNYSIIISKCTSPYESLSQSSVTKRLQEWIKEKSIAENSVYLSTTRSRGFGFLLDTMIWSWKGFVIYTVLNYLNKLESDNIDTFLKLTKIEKICYLRYFLESEGAIILKFSEIYFKTKNLTYSYLKKNIKSIFEEIINEYIDMAYDFRERIKIREIQRQMKLQTKEDNYDKDTLSHKIKPHMQAMQDLGLIEISENNNKDVYYPINFGDTSTLDIILKNLKTIKDLEDLIINYDYFSLIAKIYHLSPMNYSNSVHKDLLRQVLFYGYRIIRDKVTGMADINSLIDWCHIKMLSEDNVLITRNDIEDFLKEIRKDQPSNIRYHVNVKGRISYIIFSEPL